MKSLNSEIDKILNKFDPSIIQQVNEKHRKEVYNKLTKKEEVVSVEKRLKCIVFGLPESGKTWFTLSFPNIIHIDMEGGAEHYHDKFNLSYFFDKNLNRDRVFYPSDLTCLKNGSELPNRIRVKSNDPDEIMELVRWLNTHSHPFTTIGFDPITIFWQQVQAKWNKKFLEHNEGGAGHKGDYYLTQMSDWWPMKANHREILRLFDNLDMNIIATAHQKDEYQKGTSMKMTGRVIPNAESQAGHDFDTVINMYQDDGKWWCLRTKDRTNSLPVGVPVEASFDIFQKMFPDDTFERKANPIEYVTDEQTEDIETFRVMFKLNDGQMKRTCNKYGGVSGIEELTKENAQVIIEKFKEKEAKLDA